MLGTLPDRTARLREHRRQQIIDTTADDVEGAPWDDGFEGKKVREKREKWHTGELFSHSPTPLIHTTAGSFAKTQRPSASVSASRGTRTSPSLSSRMA